MPAQRTQPLLAGLHGRVEVPDLWQLAVAGLRRACGKNRVFAGTGEAEEHAGDVAGVGAGVGEGGADCAHEAAEGAVGEGDGGGATIAGVGVERCSG